MIPFSLLLNIIESLSTSRVNLVRLLKYLSLKNWRERQSEIKEGEQQKRLHDVSNNFSRWTRSFAPLEGICLQKSTERSRKLQTQSI
mmetsp:Transcript_3806/g.5805  ORF Transcript_3806/g.5805 Transcript_3806/m.5805 type:complete len:87 (-) Transcript_3806:1468-1728(-)